MLSKGEFAPIAEVMLIDDEPIDLFINERLLKAYGFAKRYVAFQDALLALNELERRARSSQPLPEVLFLDYFMPQIDGLDFLTRVKALEQEFPESLGPLRIIMLTTLKEPEKRRKLGEFDRIFAVMSKPLSEKAVSELNGRFLYQA